MIMTRIAILLCDIPNEALIPEHGDYEKQFTNLIHAAVAKYNLQKPSKITAFHVMKKQEYPSKVGNFDIYILSGSKFNAYDRKTVPWIDKLILFIQEIAAHKNNIKVLGVCFGHQILAEAFDGKVEKNTEFGWEVGPADLLLNKSAQKALCTTKSKMRINSMHQDIVTRLPKDFEILASTAICKNQIMLSRNNNMISIQAHPEFTNAYTKAVIGLRVANGTFSKQFEIDIHEKMGAELDGLWFFGKFLSLLMNGKSFDD